MTLPAYRATGLVAVSQFVRGGVAGDWPGFGLARAGRKAVEDDQAARSPPVAESTSIAR